MSASSAVFHPYHVVFVPLQNMMSLCLIPQRGALGYPSSEAGTNSQGVQCHHTGIAAAQSKPSHWDTSVRWKTLLSCLLVTALGFCFDFSLVWGEKNQHKGGKEIGFSLVNYNRSFWILHHIAYLLTAADCWSNNHSLETPRPKR